MAYTQVTDKSILLIMFEAIETALSELLTAKTIHSIEVFNAQTDFESEERPRKYPFVMIDMSIDWNKAEAGNRYTPTNKFKQPPQKGMMTITVHVVFSNLRHETLSFKETEAIRFEIHRAINNLQDEYFTKLQRQSTLLDSSHNRVFDLISTYQCEVEEPGLIDANLETVTDPELIVNRNIDIDNEIIRTGDGTHE